MKRLLLTFKKLSACASLDFLDLSDRFMKLNFMRIFPIISDKIGMSFSEADEFNYLSVKTIVLWFLRSIANVKTDTKNHQGNHTNSRSRIKSGLDPFSEIVACPLIFHYLIASLNYSRASRPFLSMISRSFLEAPVGFFCPCSHFCIVEVLTLKTLANAA